MPVHATVLSAATDLIAEAIALDPIAIDALLTFGLAGGLVVAAIAVLAFLPWTDQQIKDVDAEARRLSGAMARKVAPRLPTLSGHRQAALLPAGARRR
jgi:hypothetical protein